MMISPMKDNDKVRLRPVEERDLDALGGSTRILF
jgi:hypothetical protein